VSCLISTYANNNRGRRPGESFCNAPLRETQHQGKVFFQAHSGGIPLSVADTVDKLFVRGIKACLSGRETAHNLDREVSSVEKPNIAHFTADEIALVIGREGSGSMSWMGWSCAVVRCWQAEYRVVSRRSHAASKSRGDAVLASASQFDACGAALQAVVKDSPKEMKEAQSQTLGCARECKIGAAALCP
jgi:hypothetical protein